MDETFLTLKKAYRSGNRRRWVVYREAGRIFGNYSRGNESTAALAAELCVSSDVIGNWARAGWLRAACRGLTATDEAGKVWTFYDLRTVLPTAHFIIAGKSLAREEFGPQEIMDALAIAAHDHATAASLAALLLPKTEKEPGDGFLDLMGFAVKTLKDYQDAGLITISPKGMELIDGLKYEQWLEIGKCLAVLASAQKEAV